MTKHIHISNESPDKGFEQFIDAWHRADARTAEEAAVHLNFENLTLLLSLLTPRRLEAMQLLRKRGVMSVRSLSKALARPVDQMKVLHGPLQVTHKCNTLFGESNASVRIML